VRGRMCKDANLWHSLTTSHSHTVFARCRFSDFVKIQAKIRVSCNDRPTLLAALPSLPGRGIWESRMGIRSKSFVSDRQRALGVWLKGVVQVVKEEPDQLNLLLMLLELNIVHS
jgi:hypothetical protein